MVDLAVREPWRGELYDSAPCGFHSVGPEGIILRINRTELEWLGYTRGELVGKASIRQLQSPATQALFEVYFERVKRGEVIRGMEAEFVRKDGSILPVLLSTAGVFNPEGLFVATQSIVADLSDRRRAVEEASERDRFARRIIDVSPDAVYVFDLAERRTVWGSGNLPRMLGYSDQEADALGDGAPLALLHPSDQAALAQRLSRWEQVSDEQVVETEFRARNAAGDYPWLRGRAVVFARDPGGAVREVLVVVSDISEKKRAEDELRASAARLKSLSHRVVEVQEEERRHLARELHDEVGQALTAILYRLQTLKAKATPAASPVLDEAAAIADRAISQVRDISLSLRPDTLDEAGLAETLRWYAEKQVRSLGLEVDLDIPRKTVKLPTEVRHAAFRIAQEALTNVLRHAGASRVSLRLELDDAHVGIEVTDDGVGFEPEAARSSIIPGAALGLRGMLERAELLGGTIDITSFPGRGTRVRARLPFTPVMAEAT